MHYPPSSITINCRTFRVDRKAGELHDLALITGDREADGHGIYIDQRTLETARDVVQARGGRMKAAIRHPSLLDLIKTGSDRVLEVPGFFSDIAVKGNQLVAGRMQFFESFRDAHADQFALLLEMAEKTPDLFGLSSEPWGYLVFVAEDGTEYSEKPKADADGPGVALRYGGMPALRVTDLSVAAFVDEPAANDGLFAAFSRFFSRGGRGDMKKLRTIVESFFEWAAGAPDGSAVRGAPLSRETAQDSTPSQQTKDTDTMTLEALKKTFGADKDRHSRALLFVSDKPDATVEQIEIHLATADVATRDQTIAAHLATIAQRDTRIKELEAQLSAASKDRDQWKSKFDAIKTSGQSGEVNLGADGAGTGSENPFARETLNLTRQVELMKQDPKLAAALKAAAGKPASAPAAAQAN